MFRPFLLASAVVAFSLQAANFSAVSPAMAQQPTQAQRDAIRASCRSDFMANCSSVTPGGKEAMECLLRNQAKLSAACNAAVSAVVPAKPAPAAAPAEAPAPAAAKSEPTSPAASEPAPKSATAQEAELKSVRQACTLNDFMAHCSWIKPDNPELLLCLQSNASDLSPACQAAVQGMPPPAAQTPAAAPEKKPTAATPAKKPEKPVAAHEPPPAAAAAAPTEAQKSAIRAACRSDFMANCSGVQPGGAEAFQCLKSHAASLSSACRSAVAAIGGGAPASASAPPAAAAPAAAPTEAQKSAIRAACRSDFMANCSGVQPGGAEAFQCLKSHAASLSSGCQSAVAAIGGSAPAANTPTPAVAPLGPIPPMLPREGLRILAMCRAEQETLCSGMPLGGGRILNCLAEHAQQLSLQCYEALSRAAR